MAYPYAAAGAGGGGMHGSNYSSQTYGPASSQYPASAQASPYHGAAQVAAMTPSASPYPGATPALGGTAGLMAPGHAPSVSSYPGMPGVQAGNVGGASPYAGSTLGFGGGTGSTGSSTIVGGSPMPGQYGLAGGAQSVANVPPGGQLTIGPAAAAAAAAAGVSAQPFAADVKVGALTFTTSKDATGRTIYHHFRAEQATYRSPQNVTYTGIQWIPYETSYSPPTHIPPAGPDVLASFRGQLPGQALSPGVTLGATSPPVGGIDPYAYGGGGGYHDERWDKDEQRRRKKEAKEAAKREQKWEAERIARERAEEKELRRARELDARREEQARMRQLSNATGPVPMPMGPAGGYSGANAYERDRERDRERDLERRMGDMSIGGGIGGGLSAEYGGGPGTRSRRQSMSMPDPGVGVRPVMGPGAAAAMYDEPDSYDDGYVGAGGGARNSLYMGSGGGMPGDRSSYMAGGGGGVMPERSSYMAGGGEGMMPDRSGYMGGGGGGGMPERSPYRRGTQQLEPTMGPDGVPVYPRGHILEGKPFPAGGSTLSVGGAGGMGGSYSRSHSPVPGMGPPIPGTAPYPSVSPRPSPRMGGGMPLGPGGSMMSGTMPGGMPGMGMGAGGMMMPGTTASMPGGMSSMGMGAGGYTSAQEQQMLASPEAFNRPINRAHPFTPFEMAKIQDMDDFLEGILPRLPIVLTTHDVLPEDWGRLMNDIALAWQGRLPLPRNETDRQPKRSRLVGDLLQLWNDVFFQQRNIELVLYKGRERYSGRLAGRPEARLPRMDSSDSYTSDSDSEDSYSDDVGAAGRRQGYGTLGYGQGRYDSERIGAEQRETREYRRQRKEEKRRRHREKRMRKKEQSKSYSLYMSYLPPEPDHGMYTGTARSARSAHSAHSGY